MYLIVWESQSLCELVTAVIVVAAVILPLAQLNSSLRALSHSFLLPLLSSRVKRKLNANVSFVADRVPQWNRLYN